MPQPQETQAPQERLLLVFVNNDEADDLYVELELEGLVEAAGGLVVGSTRQRLGRPHKAMYVGTGKAEEIKSYIEEIEADCAVVDAELSGIQVRNLEAKWSCRVVDRTTLILDIFANRAKTREGQLQVELAQLTYRLPRLMSVYTKFERQRGGIGMRGPGETQLETDRRMVSTKISKLKEEIEGVRRHRQLQHESRQSHPIPTVSIVGYTSAGKSTLMNKICGTDLLADAMPFATLDPTTRKIEASDGSHLFLTDTVGFIRNLPTLLVAAFRATLEEVAASDLLLILIDVSHPEWEMQRDAVIETLEAIGADKVPSITVFNKIDALEDQEDAQRLVKEWPGSVGISALLGTGFSELFTAIQEKLSSRFGLVRALIPYSQNSLVESCHKFGRVILEDYREDGIYLEVDVIPEWQTKLKPYILEG